MPCFSLVLLQLHNWLCCTLRIYTINFLYTITCKHTWFAFFQRIQSVLSHSQCKCSKFEFFSAVITIKCIYICADWKTVKQIKLALSSTDRPQSASVYMAVCVPCFMFTALLSDKTYNSVWALLTVLIE